MKVLVGAFSQEKALAAAFSVIVKSSRKLRGLSFEALLPPPPAGHIISTAAADTGNTGTLQHPPGIGEGFNGNSTERYILFHHCYSIGVTSSFHLQQTA